MLTTALRPSSDCEPCTPSSVTQSPPLLLVTSTTTHLRSVRARLFCVERHVEQRTSEAVLLQPKCFRTNGFRRRCSFSRWLYWSRSHPNAWVSCGSQAEAAAPASGRRSESCHHDLRRPRPLARRHDSICGRAASRGKTRHRRPWPRIDQVALGIHRRWQEQGTWLPRVGASSNCRYTLSGLVEYLCLATAAGAECCVVLGTRVTTHPNDLKANISRKNNTILGRVATIFFKKGPIKVKNPQVGVLPMATRSKLHGCLHTAVLPTYSISCGILVSI